MRATRALLLVSATVGTLLVWLAGCGASAEEDDATEAADRAVATIDGMIANARTLLTEAAETPAISSGSPGECDKATAAAMKGLDQYGGLGRTDKKGDLDCLSIEFTPPVSTADRPYFLRATGSGEFSVGDYQLGRVTGLESIVFAVPIPAGGVVLVPLDLKALDRELAALDLPEDADLIVTDDNGTVLAHPGNPETVGKNLAGTELIDAMIERDSGTEELSGDAGERTYAFEVPADSGGHIRVAVGLAP